MYLMWQNVSGWIVLTKRERKRKMHPSLVLVTSYICKFLNSMVYEILMTFKEADECEDTFALPDRHGSPLLHDHSPE